MNMDHVGGTTGAMLGVYVGSDPPKRRRGKRGLAMAFDEEIRHASEQFYAAINRAINGAPGSMMEVWSHGSDVTTLHPLGGRETGWEEVRASWEQVAQGFSDGQVSIEDLVVVPLADDVAYTLGTEHGQASLGDERVGIDWRVTNIYRRDEGEWKVVHHHTDVSPPLVKFLKG
jgi:ketosteroid isomerase-like protein